MGASTQANGEALHQRVASSAPNDHRAALSSNSPAAISAMAKHGKIHFLHLNESPYPPSPRAISAISEAAVNLNRYADASATALGDALATRTGIPASRIVFGCGAEELIQVLCRVTVRPGDEVVLPAPSWPSFAMFAELQGGNPIRASLDESGANDPQAIIDAITPNTRLVICCTPNPPSGGMMLASSVERLVQAVPDWVMLLFDEAYFEFGQHANGPNCLSSLRKRKGPWASVRTFSKAYGLAGARIGYALCGSEDVADSIRRYKLHYGASVLAQTAALAALSDEKHLQKILTAIAEERDRLNQLLGELNLTTHPTAANFVSVTLPMAATRVIDHLSEKGILVRGWRDAAYPKEIRITVGLKNDTDALIGALREILEGQP